MKSRFGRFCALLLAMFYMSFAGGVELLHQHSDGVMSGGGRSGLSKFSSEAADVQKAELSNAPTAFKEAHSSYCVACYWAQHGQATPPSVTVPLEGSHVGAVFTVSTPALPSIHLLLTSARAPPSA